jgi:pimeloyl-ACP methyl ester carboxylesterase
VIDRLLGAVDDAYFRLNYGIRAAETPPLFRRGWGDGEAIDAVIERFRSPGQPFDIAPVWHGEWHERKRHRFRDGGFPTPLYRRFLPQVAAYARFRFISPREPTDEAVVMVPTRFEEGYRQREPLATRLAARGVGVLLLESPFMGSRRPPHQPSVMLSTLSDFVLLGGAVIEEARSVNHWIRRRGYRNVCVTGLSLGGYLAAVAGALAASPVAIVTLLAPHDGNVVYLDGLSRELCNWTELQQTCGSPGAVRDKFRAVFDAISLAHVPPPACGSPVIAIAASHDRFVPPESFRRMAALWPTTELRWVGGGHVSTVLRRGVYLAAILDALRASRLARSASKAAFAPVQG